MKRGVVYFISNGTAIKIGVTQNAVKKRLWQLQYESAEPLTVLGVIHTPPASEFEAHQKFAHLRIGGEWFRYDPEILAYIEELYMQGTRELRQQLKAIRDNKLHPGRRWARNLVAVLDDITMGRMSEDEAKAPLRECTIAFQRKMRPGTDDFRPLPAAEIAARLGLGRHAGH